MLILPKKTKQLDKHAETKKGIFDHFNQQLEKTLNENKVKDKYWILGKATIKKINGLDIVRPFLQACCEKPGIVKKSFVYEVDNRRGTKTLLWVMHPDNKLSFPTLKKSIRVTGEHTG